MSETSEEVIVWLKQKEIEALKRKQELRDKGDDYAKYFDGKAQAYSEVWEHLLAEGGKLGPVEYNRLNQRYSWLANRLATTT